MDSYEQPSVNPWLVTFSVMLATFMEILDTTVVNVSLAHIAGNLAATVDEGTWVVTSYLVSNAIVLPMAGWLARRFVVATCCWFAPQDSRGRRSAVAQRLRFHGLFFSVSCRGLPAAACSR